MRWRNPKTPSQKYINIMGGYFSAALGPRLTQRIEEFPFSPDTLLPIEPANDHLIKDLLPKLKEAIATGDFARFSVYLGPHTELKYRQYAQRYIKRLAAWSTNNAKGAKFYEVAYRIARLFFQFLEYERIWKEFERTSAHTLEYSELLSSYQTVKDAYNNRGLTSYYKALKLAPALKDFFITQWDEQHFYDEYGEDLSTGNLSEEDCLLLLAILRQESTIPGQLYQPSALPRISYLEIPVNDSSESKSEEKSYWKEKFEKATCSTNPNSFTKYLIEIEEIIQASYNPITIYDAIEKRQYEYVVQCIQAHDSQKAEAEIYVREVTQLRTTYQAEAKSFFDAKQDPLTQTQIVESGIGSKPLCEITIDSVPLLYMVAAAYVSAPENSKSAYSNMAIRLIERGALLKATPNQNVMEYAVLPRLPNSWIAALGNSLSTKEIYPFQRLLTREILYITNWFLGFIFQLTHNEQDTKATVNQLIEGQRLLYFHEKPECEQKADALMLQGRSIFLALPSPSEQELTGVSVHAPLLRSEEQPLRYGT